MVGDATAYCRQSQWTHTPSCVGKFLLHSGSEALFLLVHFLFLFVKSCFMKLYRNNFSNCFENVLKTFHKLSKALEI